MKRIGTLDNPEDLREFTLGFTQGKASFDFIDVGHGKERADSKIRGTLRLTNMLPNMLSVRFINKLFRRGRKMEYSKPQLQTYPARRFP